MFWPDRSPRPGHRPRPVGAFVRRGLAEHLGLARRHVGQIRAVPRSGPSRLPDARRTPYVDDRRRRRPVDSAKARTEGAVALGIAKQIVDHGWSSASEISAFQQNMPEGALDDYNIESVAERTGVPADRILKAAEKLGTNRPAVAFGGEARAHTPTEASTCGRSIP